MRASYPLSDEGTGRVQPVPSSGANLWAYFSSVRRCVWVTSPASNRTR